jgi:hypothetical protein
MNPENPYHWLTVYGRVVEVVDEYDPERGHLATESIDDLAEKYLGQRPYPFRDEGEIRVLLHGRARESRDLRAGRRLGDELPPSTAPPDDGEPVAALNAGPRVELKSAEERRRRQRASGGERSLGRELEAVVGDERGGIGLRGDVIELAEAGRARLGDHLLRGGAELGRGAEVGVPLDGREEALGVVAEQVGEGGEPGRDAGEERAGRRGERTEELDLALDGSAGEERVRPGGEDAAGPVIEGEPAHDCQAECRRLALNTRMRWSPSLT